MKTYVAKCDSYGFQKRYWIQGDTVELPDDHKCPEYFEPLIGELQPKAPVVEEPKTFSEINKERENSKPKTGMAHTPKEEVKPSKKKK